MVYGYTSKAERYEEAIVQPHYLLCEVLASYPHPIQAPKIDFKGTSNINGIDCVSTLKRSGDLPQGTVTVNGFAETIPTKPLVAENGEEKVIVTSEGRVGHTLKVRKEPGCWRSIVEGNHSIGVGRCVPESVIVGEVDMIGGE